MSKSDESEYSRIDLKDSADDIVKKIKKAKSDSSPIPDNLKDLEKKPEAFNLINIYSNLTNNSFEESLNELKGREYSYLKGKLSEILVELICPVGKKMREMLNDKSFLEKVLKEGTEKARDLAEYNLKEIRNVIGFL